MKVFENPIEFETKKNFDNIEVSFSNLMEIAQGGPEIGNISINGKLISDYRFGGPILYDNGSIYATVYVKKFFKSGFQIARINLSTLSIDVLGKIRDLVFLDRISNRKVYFFRDLERNRGETFDLDS